MKKVLSFFLAVVMLCSAAPVEAYAAAAPKATSITKLTTKNGAITVKWKKVKGVTGYQIQYSTDKKFKKNVKKVTVKKAKTVKKTIKKLKAKKTYHVRVRAYKLKKGKKKYSKWCKKKSIKVKKAAASSTSDTSTTSGTTNVLIPNKVRIDAEGNYNLFLDNKWVSDPIKLRREGSYGHYKLCNKYYELLYKTYINLNLNDTMNDIDKLTIIARWFEENYTYAFTAEGVPDRDYVTGYDLLTVKKSVCDGFSGLLRDVCFLADIPCVRLVSSNHAWNGVKLQGYWYQVDFTGGSSTWWKHNTDNLKSYLENDELDKNVKQELIEETIHSPFFGSPSNSKRNNMTSDSKEMWKKCVPQGTMDSALLQVNNVANANELAKSHNFK